MLIFRKPIEGIERPQMPADVVIVGGGPAGMACALRLSQLIDAHNEAHPDSQLSKENIYVLEKAREIGQHCLSGALLDPRSMNELLPGFEKEAPIDATVERESVYFLSEKSKFKFPITPPPLRDHGNYVISLNRFVKWLGSKVEATGITVFTGFAGSELLFDGNRVTGVRTDDKGVDKEGHQKSNFEPGYDLQAKIVILAEGPRGSLTKQLIAKFDLARGHCPQTFALGYKELWQLPPGRVRAGRIEHGLGWPADRHTYAGSFLYHLDKDRVYVGYIVGLDYQDPRLQPFEAFQQYKNHPSVKALLEGGEIVSAGARTVAAGGWQSTPTLEMPGAILIGDAGGTLNFAKIKGVHQAIRSGVLAGEHVAESGAAAGFDARWRASAGGQELKRVRNFKPAFKRGLWPGLINSAWEMLTAGKSPWTLKNSADWSRLHKLEEYTSPERGWVERSLPPRDRVSFVFFAGNAHEESQPVHLKVADTDICAQRCGKEYGNPCERFCPAGVYEMVDDGAGGRRLQINAANCVHCKACDIKDPYQIITWTTPEGGSGPNYQSL